MNTRRQTNSFNLSTLLIIWGVMVVVLLAASCERASTTGHSETGVDAGAVDTSPAGDVNNDAECQEGERVPCYSDDPDSEGVGECKAGEQICEGGTYGACTGEVKPSPEVCNGLDDDCDGQVDEGDPGGGQSCDSGQPGVCTAGTSVCSAAGTLDCIPNAAASDEQCDGLDNDCDGTVDEELLQNLGGDQRITDEIQYDDFVAVGWSGTAFGVVWSRGPVGARELYYRTLDPKGLAVISETQLTSGAEDTAAHLIWNPDGQGVFAVVHSRDDDQVYFRQVRANGTLVGDEVQLRQGTGMRSYPWIDYNGTHYGVTWHESVTSGEVQVFFALVEPDGTVAQTLQVTTAQGWSRFANVKWNGNAWGVVWADDRTADREQIYYARISADGSTKEVNDVAVSSSGGDARWPNLEWGSGEFAVTWHDDRDGDEEIYFARLDPDGTLLGGEVRLTQESAKQTFASVDWTGAEYMVAWQDGRHGSEEIYYALVSANGTKSAPEGRITNATGNSSFVTAIWTGNLYGIGWRDERDGNPEIYFSYLGCP